MNNTRKHAATINYSGEYMQLYADGKIGRNNWQPSGQWLCTGAVRLNNFGKVVEHFTLDEVINGKLQWKHKNGKQRIHITDLDHGTHRIWMNPKHEVYKC